MITLIEDRREEIIALCKRFGIRRPELFGSATSSCFDHETSDLDFIADVGDYGKGVGMRFLKFCTALDKLMERQVDVITEKQIENPYFRASVNAARTVIYDASDSEAGA
jgi:predicted nucleotidyltransferase